MFAFSNDYNYWTHFETKIVLIIWINYCVSMVTRSNRKSKHSRVYCFVSDRCSSSMMALKKLHILTVIREVGFLFLSNWLEYDRIVPVFILIMNETAFPLVYMQSNWKLVFPSIWKESDIYQSECIIIDHWNPINSLLSVVDHITIEITIIILPVQRLGLTH